MNRNVLPLLATAALLPFGAQGAKKSQPNVLFLLMDDLGSAEVGWAGQERIETPHLDALAKSGKILTQHYSGSPVSAPSRCVLLTGMHSGHSVVRGNDEAGARGNVWSHQAMFENPGLEGQGPMPADTRTMAKAFKEAGYTTGCIGKWGLGYPGSESEPNRMGFDFFYGYNCQRQAHTYYPTHLYRNTERQYLRNKVLQPATLLDKGADPMDPASYAKYTQTDFAPEFMRAETLKFLEANKDNPFFLWWTTPLPHVALQAPEKWVNYYLEKFGPEPPYTGNKGYFPSRYPHATYAAMVSYIDEQVGEMVAKLKELGVYDNTIIVFTSDNGPTFNGGTDSPWFDSARPFKSEAGWGKASVMEGGLRVPTCVVWPGKIKKETTSNHLSSFPDWWATLADLTGIQPAADGDGVSMAPLLLGKKSQKAHDFLYWEYPEGAGQLALRQGDWKLVVKNIRKEPTYFLFNLAADPREQTNLAEQEPERLQALKALATSAHRPPVNPRFEMGLPLK